MRRPASGHTISRRLQARRAGRLRGVGKAGRIGPVCSCRPSLAIQRSASVSRPRAAAPTSTSNRPGNGPCDQTPPSGRGRVEISGAIRSSARHRTKKLICPLLDPAGEYVGFNGNKLRKGQGYRLLTPGGWLAKAGYAADEVKQFHSDLATLVQQLGLTAAGLHIHTKEWLDLTAMQRLACTPAGAHRLSDLHLRIYAGAGYLRRWTSYFEPEKQVSEPAAVDRISALIRNLEHQGIRRRTLALAIKADPSFLTKALNGKKPFPQPLLDAAEAWLTEQNASAPACPTTAWPEMPTVADDHSLRPFAQYYLQQGWSVVPQRAGAKQPLVRWKPFQDKRPTMDQLREWFQTWPEAGIPVYRSNQRFVRHRCRRTRSTCWTCSIDWGRSQ